VFGKNAFEVDKENMSPALIAYKSSLKNKQHKDVKFSKVSKGLSQQIRQKNLGQSYEAADVLIA